MSYAAPSLRPRQRDQVQRVAGRYTCLSVTRLPGDWWMIGPWCQKGNRAYAASHSRQKSDRVFPILIDRICSAHQYLKLNATMRVILG
jgi:hypothetical protein